MYRVFRLPSAQRGAVDALLGDDLVSRQSITAREASSLGLEGTDTVVLVEGADGGVARAIEIMKRIHYHNQCRRLVEVPPDDLGSGKCPSCGGVGGLSFVGASPLEGRAAEDAYRRFRSQDDEAASGMGLIFGP